MNTRKEYQVDAICFNVCQVWKRTSLRILLVVRFHCITALNSTNTIWIQSGVKWQSVPQKLGSIINRRYSYASISKYIDTDKNRLAYSMIYAFLICSTIPTAQFKFMFFLIAKTTSKYCMFLFQSCQNLEDFSNIMRRQQYVTI